MTKYEYYEIVRLQGLLNQAEQTNQQQAARIKQLESDLYKAQLKMGGGRGAVDDIIAQADKTREQLQDTIDKLKILYSDYGLHQVPFVVDDDEAEQNAKAKTALLPPGQGMEFWPYSDKTCTVEILIGIRTRDRVIPIRDVGIFAGSTDEAERELPMIINAAIRRAPLPTEISRYGLFGVNDERLYEAICFVAPYWQANDDRLSSKINEVFKGLILVDIRETKGYIPKDIPQFKAEFNRTLRQTFDKMLEKSHRGTAEQPRRKGGRSSQVSEE